MPLLARLVYASMICRERRRGRDRAARGGAGESTAADPAEHLETGRRGEALAFWYLRCQGYIMVARNLRLRQDAGELDMAGWDGPVLAFIEVKTRTSSQAGLPEEAVGNEQRKRLSRAAQIFIRRLGRKDINYRFDIVSVLWNREQGYQLNLIKDAFRAANFSQR